MNTKDNYDDYYKSKNKYNLLREQEILKQKIFDAQNILTKKDIEQSQEELIVLAENERLKNLLHKRILEVEHWKKMYSDIDNKNLKPEDLKKIIENELLKFTRKEVVDKINEYENQFKTLKVTLSQMIQNVKEKEDEVKVKIRLKEKNLIKQKEYLDNKMDVEFSNEIDRIRLGYEKKLEEIEIQIEKENDEFNSIKINLENKKFELQQEKMDQDIRLKNEVNIFQEEIKNNYLVKIEEIEKVFDNEIKIIQEDEDNYNKNYNDLNFDYNEFKKFEEVNLKNFLDENLKDVNLNFENNINQSNEKNHKELFELNDHISKIEREINIKRSKLTSKEKEYSNSYNLKKQDLENKNINLIQNLKREIDNINIEKVDYKNKLIKINKDFNEKKKTLEDNNKLDINTINLIQRESNIEYFEKINKLKLEIDTHKITLEKNRKNLNSNEINDSLREFENEKFIIDKKYKQILEEVNENFNLEKEKNLNNIKQLEKEIISIKNDNKINNPYLNEVKQENKNLSTTLDNLKLENDKIISEIEKIDNNFNYNFNKNSIKKINERKVNNKVLNKKDSVNLKNKILESLNNYDEVDPNEMIKSLILSQNILKKKENISNSGTDSDYVQIEDKYIVKKRVNNI